MFALIQEHDDTTKLKPCFNCHLVPKVFTLVTIAALPNFGNHTMLVKVPYMTNTIQLKAGETLYLETVEKTKHASAASTDVKQAKAGRQQKRLRTNN